MPKRFLLALAFLACSPSLKTQVQVQLQPLPSDADVKVFPDSLPACPYQQVGLIASHDMDKTLKAARRMGADGVIGTVLATPSKDPDGAPLCGTRKCVEFNTVAIRFEDPSCRD
jgi:hypothetical protein